MRSKLKRGSFLFLVGLVSLVILLSLWISGGLANARQSQKVAYSQKEFIQTIAPTAQKLSETYGVKASVIIGQAALESNYGTSLLGSKYHNLFSIEADEGESGILLQNKEFRDTSWQTVEKTYLVYKSWDDSMYDYLARLRQGKVGGKGLYKALATSASYRAAAKTLQAGGLSSDPEYANELIAVIDGNSLTDYDK